MDSRVWEKLEQKNMVPVTTQNINEVSALTTAVSRKKMSQAPIQLKQIHNVISET